MLKKLDTIVTKDAPFVGMLDSGHHVVTLNYKTDKDTGIKKSSESWIVPKLSDNDHILVTNDTINSAVQKWIDSLQKDALTEYAAGDLEFGPTVSDLELLCKDYITDNRGERTGPKQSQLNDWITSVLVPYLKVRIGNNLTNEKGYTEEQRGNMLASYQKKFKLAATRSNRSGNETLSDAALQDLQQRMSLYNDIPASVEKDAIVARIALHRETIAKSVAEVPTDAF